MRGHRLSKCNHSWGGCSGYCKYPWNSHRNWPRQK